VAGVTMGMIMRVGMGVVIVRHADNRRLDWFRRRLI
jgi:hypothetical protein